MTLDEQIAFLRELAADCLEAANMAAGIPLLERVERERAARLLTCAATIDAERRRRIECAGDWS
jgi:hypothetical protein